MIIKIRSCLRLFIPTKYNFANIKENQNGNIFFALFGAVAIVGLLGTAIMSTMRGPLSTMVEIQSRTQAESEMAIASHLALLEATELTNAGDCDSDGFVEPLEFADAGGLGPVGGGFLPNAVASSHLDPWGTEYGYCAWDAGGTTNAIGCDIDASGTNNRLDGNGSTTDETYTVIAIISAGPDQAFGTTCTGGANPSITKTGDDIVVEYTYATATAAANGLWNIKSGDPSTAEISKNLEITGAASFTAGIDLTGSSAALALGAASMLFPNEATLNTCNAANDGLIRIKTNADPDYLELCDDPNGWVSIGGNLWVTGAGDDIYYDLGTPQIGIGTNAPSEALDVAGNIKVSGNIVAGGNIEGNDFTANGDADITGTLDVTGATTLSTLNASGAVDFASTLNVTGLITGTSGIYIRNTDTSFAVNTAGHYTGDYRFQVPSGTTRNITFRHTSGGWNAAKIDVSKLSGSNHDGTMHLYTTGHGNSQLFLDELGNIGIGTTSPNAQLHVSGSTILTSTLNAQGTISNSTGNVSIGDNLDVSNDLDVTGDIDGTDISASSDLNASSTINVNGDQLGPALNCTSTQKLEWNNGSGWSCVTDLQGGGSGGIPALDDLTDVAVTTPANGECLIYDNGSGEWGNAPCIGTGAGIFEIVSNVTRVKSTAGDYTNDDFVFGSPQLEDDGDTSHDNRMFFDKSKGAFRAGGVTSAEWDDANIGTYSFAIGLHNTASGSESFAGGWDSTASGFAAFAWGNGATANGHTNVAIGEDVATSGGDRAFAFGQSVTTTGSRSFSFGLGNTAGVNPRVSASESFGIFMGDQSGVNLSVSNRMGLYGGDLLIDDDGTTGSQGCIQYNGTTSELEFSDDCTTFTAFSDGSLGLWTDLTGGRIHYGTTSANQVGVGTSNPQTTLDVNGGIRVGSVSGGAAPTFMAINDLSDVAAAAPSNSDCLVYNNASSNWENVACSSLGGASNIFEVTGGAGSEVVSSVDANAPYTTAGFVFGSPQLDDDGDTNHDSRMFFDKSKGAFRAGNVDGTQWDSGSIGQYSAAVGWNNTASGTASFAAGQSSVASNSYTIALGDQATASGDRAVVIGNGTASGLGSAVFGGAENSASGIRSTALGGRLAIAGGEGSYALGYGINVTGDYSFGLSLGNNYPPGTIPIVSAANSYGVFMGSNFGVDLTRTNTMALYNGELMIDDDGTAGSQGCIRYLEGTGLQYSDDCSTFSSFASLGGVIAINDLSDATTDYTIDHNMLIGEDVANGLLAGNTYNLGIGEHALNGATTSQRNVAVGYAALYSNTAGYNSALGVATMYNATGSNNSAFGYRIMFNGGPGDDNTIMGYQAAYTLDGSDNVIMGSGAGQAATTSDTNVMIGYQAGNLTTTGDSNILIGNAVQASTITASNELNIGNVITGDMATGDIAIIGTAALAHPSGTTAQRPTGVNGMIRYNSTLNEFEGYENGSWVSIGGSAGAGAINDLSDAYTDYTTDHNMFFGNTAGGSILAGGNNNVFIGEIAGEDTTSGSYNVFIGKEAGRNNIAGEWNTFVGDDAGRANTSGSYNSAFGGYSLRANTGGSQNTAIGDGTLEVNTSGGNNTALGRQALFTSGTGNNNVALGRNALHTSNGASNNTAIGTNAGDNITTGDNNIIIGYNIDAASATGDNQLNIGDVITGDMATGDIAIIGTAALAHPSGTTAQRPTGVNGMIRYNSTLNEFEGYENGSWTSMGSGAGASLWTDNTTHVSRENFHILDAGLAAGSTTAGLDGDGTYAFYDPDKGALRGGEITGSNDAWEDTNIGANSFAWGSRTQASATGSVALGSRSSATNSYAFAHGNNTVASGYNSTAIGGSVVASGQYSFATGRSTTASGNYGITMGLSTTASGEGTMAIGLTTIANNPGTAPIVSGNESFGIFMGDQSGYDLTTANRMALVGGDFLIDDDGTAGSQGCIRYLQGTGLQFSHDCSTYTTMGSGSGSLWTDNTTHVTRENVHILDTGLAAGSTTAGLDGNGTYSFYDPDKGAMRGGAISGGNVAWEDTNIGTNSFAWGLNAQASGLTSFAIGAGNVASGNVSFAVGDSSVASGNYSTAIGALATASGDFSTAIGIGASATGANSTALGAGASAIGANSTALGIKASASGEGAMAFGLTTVANNPATAPIVSGDESLGIFMGNQSGIDITDNNTMAILGGDFIVGSYQFGDTTTGTQDSRMFFDRSSGAFRAGTTAGTQWNSANVGANSTALGANTTASGDGSMAIGGDTTASGENSTAIGDSATASGDVSMAIGDSTTASGDVSIAMGEGTTASGGVSAAWGVDTIASGYTSVTWGQETIASGENSIAIGRETSAGSGTAGDGDGDNSFAIGLQSATQATDPIITGDRSMVLYMDGGVANANSAYDFTASDKFAIIGGEFQIDDISSSANKGCIRYNSATTKIQYSHDCSTFSNMGSGSGAINDLSDAYTDYTTDHNMFIGSGAGAAIASGGTQNLFIGESSGALVTTSDGNTAVGFETLDVNTSGEYQAAFGSGTLTNNTTGTKNSAFGASAMYYNTDGSNNIALGHLAGRGNSGGASPENSAFIGYYSGLNITTGINNTLLGYNTGATLTTGGNNILIGASTNVPASSTSNYLNIGNTIYGDLANDYVGIGNSAPDAALDVTGDIEYTGTLTDVSDRRLKDNIKPLGQTLDRIAQIDTYSFTMKDDKKGRTEFGVMAQELEEIFPTLVHTAKDEIGTKSVNYIGLIAPMIEATKELRAENTALKAELSGVKTTQAQTTQALKDLSQQVALLNKMAGNNVGKASMMPYFMLLFGLLGGMGFMLLIQRKQQK